MERHDTQHNARVDTQVGQRRRSVFSLSLEQALQSHLAELERKQPKSTTAKG